MNPDCFLNIRNRLLAAAVCTAVVGGCGEVEEGNERPSWWGYYAAEVVSFEPGEGAGFNEEKLPDIALGPPDGKGTHRGSMEVVSLGDGGEIVVGFGQREIVDGEGDDFVVFENSFWEAGDPDKVWAELGEVSVSEDGETWHRFRCEYDVDDEPPYDGCAGWTPTLDYDPDEVVPVDADKTGGDAFDLSDVGVDRARYVRIRDVWGLGSEPSQGFDLDAVGIINGD